MLATLNDLQIAYTDEGEGLPLIFIHGFPLNRQAWSSQVEAFKGRYRVITPDLRGFGESEASEGPVPMALFADDIAALHHHLGLGPAVVVGHSMGGYIAMALAATHPGMLWGLVLVGTRPGADSGEAAQIRRATAEQVLAEGPAVVVEAMAKKMLFDADPKGPKAAPLRACLAPASPKGIAGALLGMAQRPDSGAVLEKLRVPTLLLAGAEDSIIPPGESEAMAKLIPGAQLKLIPQAGHLVAVEQGEAFNAALEAWLQWDREEPAWGPS